MNREDSCLMTPADQQKDQNKNDEDNQQDLPGCSCQDQSHFTASNKAPEEVESIKSGTSDIYGNKNLRVSELTSI